jgi:hypothetical protein
LELSCLSIKLTASFQGVLQQAFLAGRLTIVSARLHSLICTAPELVLIKELVLAGSDSAQALYR